MKRTSSSIACNRTNLSFSYQKKGGTIRTSFLTVFTVYFFAGSPYCTVFNLKSKKGRQGHKLYLHCHYALPYNVCMYLSSEKLCGTWIGSVRCYNSSCNAAA